MAEIIYNQEITDELFQSFLDYSMSVITDRSLPDVRSGLKPIHTKILYAAHQLGLKSDKSFRKAAKLVGLVIGDYSPHGDEATYQAIVKLVQDFYLRYPLMLGEGAWGSQDGDEAAAYRYTLCKLSKYGELMLKGIDENAVNFKPTFSNEGSEPTVLPALFPALICNGSSGIATGIAQKFAPHNLTEVCEGIIAYLKNENITTKELMNYIKGPDFPTGCIVTNKDSLAEFYEYGKGSIRLQGKYHFEPNGKYSDIVFTEIPYGVSKEKVIEKIATLCSKAELTNIVDIHDDSTFKDGVRFVIQTTLKSEEDLNSLVNLILDKTDLETTFSINQNAIVEGNPKLVNLKEMIYYYCEHQKQIITRVSQNEKDKLLVQLEKLDGLLIALAHIEDIIQLIKTSENRKMAKERLMTTYNFTELQADTILDMKLAKLTKIDGMEINKKQENIKARLLELENILSNPNKLIEVLIEKIEWMKKNYGDARRTELINKERPKKSVKKDILNEDTTVLITTKGEIKRVNNYKKTTVALKAAIKTNTLSTICIFMSDGSCYKVPVRKIPLVLKNSDKGERLTNLNIPANEEILLILDSSNLTGLLNIISKQGYCKSINLEECNTNRTSRFTKLKDNDKVAICQLHNNKPITIKTNKVKERVIDKFAILSRAALGNKPKNWSADEFIE